MKFFSSIFLHLHPLLLSIRQGQVGSSGEERRLLGSEERELRESELNYLGLSCSAPRTNDDEAIKGFKDITGEKTFNLKSLLKQLLCSDILR